MREEEEEEEVTLARPPLHLPLSFLGLPESRTSFWMAALSPAAEGLQVFFVC